MASGPITSWQIDGETVKTVADFIFGGSKITADGDCSHEIKSRLLLGGKVMTNLDSILKSRYITLMPWGKGCSRIFCRKQRPPPFICGVDLKEKRGPICKKAQDLRVTEAAN